MSRGGIWRKLSATLKTDGIIMERMQKPSELVTLAFKAVAVGMSVAAIVLGVLGTATPATLITLLAIGLFCLAVVSLK
jgi:hypothetical protein